MKWTSNYSWLVGILGFYAVAYFGPKSLNWLPFAVAPAEFLLIMGLVIAGCIGIFGSTGSNSPDWRAGSDWGGDGGDGGD